MCISVLFSGLHIGVSFSLSLSLYTYIYINIPVVWMSTDGSNYNHARIYSGIHAALHTCVCAPSWNGVSEISR